MSSQYKANYISNKITTSTFLYRINRYIVQLLRHITYIFVLDKSSFIVKHCYSQYKKTIVRTFAF